MRHGSKIAHQSDKPLRARRILRSVDHYGSSSHREEKPNNELPMAKWGLGVKRVKAVMRLAAPVAEASWWGYLDADPTVVT